MSETIFTIESRETNSAMPALLQEAGVPFAMAEMPAGDYGFGDYLVEPVDYAVEPWPAGFK